MKWASAITTARSVANAVSELKQEMATALPSGMDLAFLFVSPYFKNDYDHLPAYVSDQLGCNCLIGCSAGGVIGGAREMERQPAISLLAASLPNVSITPFHRDHSDLPDLDASPKQWETCFGIPATDPSYIILIADPLTLDVEKAVQGLDYAYPHSIKVGGLASGGEGAGQGGLFLDRTRFRSGLVGVGLSGQIVMDTVVAHGCRPIGRPFSITRCDHNLVAELDHKKAIDVLRDLFSDLSEAEQQKIPHSIFIGLATTPFQENLNPNDFLIRPLMGFDVKTGALAVGAIPREGQMAQFHLRDQETSAEDLKWSLGDYQIENELQRPSGALLFACTGRGTYFYGKPDVDTSIFHSIMGRVPLGGFFCNGEIGAVDKITRLHGYTSCFGIFRSPSN